VANPFFGRIPASSSLGDPTITRAQLMKPYPEFTTVSLYRNNVGKTEYNAFYFKVQQRLSGGLSYLVSYTRSKLLDQASSVFDASIPTGPVSNSSSPADTYNPHLENDYSTGDIPHVFVTSAVWELPFGWGRPFNPKGVVGGIVRDWSLTAILTMQSGVPIPVVQSTNNNAFAGFLIQRPLLVGDPELPADQRQTGPDGHWFNTAAFATAPQFVLGTASRNPVRGPGYRNLDIALIRRINVAPGRAIEMRAEAFNVTNTPAWGSPNGTFGSPAFGTITTAGDPRVIQLGLKFLF
jgi:hypothetical protein